MLFAIGRSIQSDKHLDLCRRAYFSIRTWYPDAPILIVDDNSTLVDPHENLYANCTVVTSEFKAAEIGVYHYARVYAQQHSDINTIMCLHDSMVVRQPLNITAEVMFLWDFPHHCVHEEDTYSIRRLVELDPTGKLLQRYQERKWTGAFGVAAVISVAFLERLFTTYDMQVVIRREPTEKLERCAMERVFAVLCYELRGRKVTGNMPTLCGSIYAHPCNFQLDKVGSYNYDQPMLKTWQGR